MNNEYEIIAKDIVYDGFFVVEKYTVKHTLFAGGWSNSLSRELFRRNNCVGVILYDPIADKVVLIEQFRVGAAVNTGRGWLVEIVAGAIDYGETPEQAVIREAKEEAGCDILELRLIQRFYTSPGGSSEMLSLFYGRIDSAQVGGLHGVEHEDEDILVYTVSLDEAYEMVKAGKIESGIPIIAIQWLMLNRNNLI